jgi:hypothetical protein
MCGSRGNLHGEGPWGGAHLPGKVPSVVAPRGGATMRRGGGNQWRNGGAALAADEGSGLHSG